MTQHYYPLDTYLVLNIVAAGTSGLEVKSQLAIAGCSDMYMASETLDFLQY